MRTLKYSIGTALTSASFLLVPAVPVAADTTNTDSFNNTTTNTVTTTTTTTNTNTESNDGIEQDGEKNIAIQGNCSGVIISRVSQSQSSSQNSSNSNNNGGGGGPWALELNHEENGVPSNNTNDQSNSSNQSSSNSQSASINFSPDCSVHNVTQAAGGQGGGAVAPAVSAGGAGAGVVQAAQVEAPKGGVGAGVGGAFGTSLGAVLGLGGSLSSLGLGLRRLNKFEL